jgi:hypothetical protein
MPPYGFGRKEQPQSFTTDITDKQDLEEIKEIAEMLNPSEEVFVVARQSRLNQVVLHLLLMLFLLPIEEL